ncbi:MULTISPECIES: hypothetical protein [unclassified Brevibacillus]|uniref:hypothetical protein n=1 Tax=unclassified Brevibacillus TaxID=2684853 RepID=UPI00356235B2
MKFRLAFILALALILPACSETAGTPEVPLPAYVLAIDRFDESTGMWMVALATESNDEKELRALVENTRTLAKDKKEEINSVSVTIIKPDGRIPSTITAFGRIALTSKGMEQTGLSSTSEMVFEYRNAPAASPEKPPTTPAKETAK